MYNSTSETTNNREHGRARLETGGWGRGEGGEGVVKKMEQNREGSGGERETERETQRERDDDDPQVKWSPRVPSITQPSTTQRSELDLE